MPANGPANMKGLTFSVDHKNVRIVGIDVFEKELMGLNGQNAELSDGTITWLDGRLKTPENIAHTIVFGHTPVLGPVRRKSSSGLMYTGGRESAFWQTMKKHGVAVYLCGEVHQMTCIEQDGIEQIAHGGLFGYNTDVNYLVVRVTPTELRLELKEIETVLSGLRRPQSAGNEPREIVTITPEVKREGFRTVGTMTVKKSGADRRFLDKTGYFVEDDNPKE